jgi:hypothetical protein
MKTVFDKPDRDVLIERIKNLTENSIAQWGKMNVYQMLKHCALWEEMLLGKTTYRQSFLGRLFGKIALRDMLKDEPVKHNLPTVPSFKISGNGDVETAKDQWIGLLEDHTHQENSGFIHPFFGQLTADEAGRMAYKHADHHLRQFSV